MLAIITGTIKPNCELKQLCLRDEEERLVQYIECIRFYIKSKAFSDIIFCENSGYGIDIFQSLITEAKRNKIRLEVMSFRGEQQKVIEQGKGYGEGEIMEYVFRNSSLIKDNDYFVKITGRLKIVNIKKIVKSLKDSRCYFNIPNKVLKTFYDTRFYGMSKQKFEQYFKMAYLEVMDEQGIYLEHIYTNVIKKHDLKVMNFPMYPRIIGVSGTSGAVYDYVEWKCIIKDMLSKFNYYKVRN